MSKFILNMLLGFFCIATMPSDLKGTPQHYKMYLEGKISQADYLDSIGCPKATVHVTPDGFGGFTIQ